jgi:hypothetical protein
MKSTEECSLVGVVMMERSCLGWKAEVSECEVEEEERNESR